MGYMMDLRKVVGSRPLIMVGACVLVWNKEGHLLLQKRTDSNDWGTIGGSLELAESLEEAAARELFEEAGLKAKGFTFITLLSGMDMYYKYPHGDEIYNVMAVYEAIDVEGIPCINDDEGLELKYFALEGPIPNLNPFTELVLRKIGFLPGRPRRIEITQGTEDDKPIFRNLMQYYQYDSSDYSLDDPNSFGQFDYKYLDHCWTPHGADQEGRKAYLIRVDGKLAGFVLVNHFNLRLEIKEETMNITEFFIMRKWRRQGIGKFVAHQIFDTFRGQWEVKQEKENRNAHKFWETVISEYTKGDYERQESHAPEWDGPVIRFRNVMFNVKG